MPRLVVAERRLAPPDVRADATYLITGGSGAVGVAIARALAARGARHLWLASRRGTVPSDLQRDLDAAGVRVQAAAVDVTTRHAVWALIDDISRSGPPLAGIVHAAGIAVDGTVPKQTVESWLAVARPKVLGAWFLHEATRGRRLDWFLLVSSAAGLLGSPGQANYAAANAWLAGLAAWRRAQGLPAQALAFGPWRSTGLAAVDGADRRSAALGMALLEPADAACAWWTAVQVDAPEVGIWPAVEAAPERQTGVARAAVSRVPDARRRVLVDEHVCRIVASVLQLDPAVAVDRHRGFLDMGLDSLMAVDLKRRFEEEFAVSVPMTLAFDHPTVDAVVTWLLSQITVGEDGAVAAAPTAPAQTSDADLARELGDLERWLQ